MLDRWICVRRLGGETLLRPAERDYEGHAPPPRLLEWFDDDLAVGGRLFADDFGDLIFEGGLGLGEDVGFFDGFTGALKQGVDGFLALLFGDFIPETVFVLEDFDVGLFDGMDAGGW